MEEVPLDLLNLTNNEGFDTLLTKDITKSSALQRAGRAGREVYILSAFTIARI